MFSYGAFCPIVLAMSTNGTNPDDPDNQKGRIIRFPSESERREIGQQKRRVQEDADRATQPQTVPFFNLQNIPPFTGTLVGTFVFIHIAISFFANEGLTFWIMYTFGFTPGKFTGAVEPWEWINLVTPLSHALLHGGWMHLLFNAVMGLALGIFFERLYGTRTAAIFFILCTLFGALAYTAFSPFAITPMIGASGGISGLFGAALILMNEQRRMMIGGGNPWPMLIFWGAFMSVPGILMGEPVAWQAHLGGYICGIVLLLGLKRGQLKF